MRTPGFWYRPKTGAAVWPLIPFGALYGMIGRRRIATARPHRLAIPVICVGNLVAGGAGKTPVVLALLAALKALGWTPHALTRGHGGRLIGPIRVDLDRHTAADVGDEPLLLAAEAPVWVARDRVAGGNAAVGAGADILVMDDGFQNPHLIKDISLVVVDGGVGFGNRRLIPAGPLRERISDGLKRADAVVMIGGDRTQVGAKVGVDAAQAGVPVMAARLIPDPADAARLSGKPVLAFAGIGRPEKFFDTLRELGAELVETHCFADHHPYTTAEISRLMARAAALGAIPVTTTKDHVRLPPESRAAVEAVAIRLLWKDPATLDHMLDRLKNPQEEIRS